LQRITSTFRPSKLDSKSDRKAAQEYAKQALMQLRIKEIHRFEQATSLHHSVQLPSPDQYLPSKRHHVSASLDSESTNFNTFPRSVHNSVDVGAECHHRRRPSAPMIFDGQLDSLSIAESADAKSMSFKCPGPGKRDTYRSRVEYSGAVEVGRHSHCERPQIPSGIVKHDRAGSESMLKERSTSEYF